MAKVLEQSTFRRYAAKVLSQLLFLLLSMYQFHIKHTCSADSVAVAVIDAKSFSAEFEFSSTFVVLAEYRVRKRCSQLIVRVVKQRSCTKQQQSSSSQKLICICIMYALLLFALCHHHHHHNVNHSNFEFGGLVSQARSARAYNENLRTKGQWLRASPLAPYT